MCLRCMVRYCQVGARFCVEDFQVNGQPVVHSLRNSIRGLEAFSKCVLRILCFRNAHVEACTKCAGPSVGMASVARGRWLDRAHSHKPTCIRCSFIGSDAHLSIAGSKARPDGLQSSSRHYSLLGILRHFARSLLFSASSYWPFETFPAAD